MNIRFFIEADGALGTLESTLASVRRGGLSLYRLDVHQQVSGMSISMQILEADDALCSLLLARLHNIVGIRDLHEVPIGAPMTLAVEP